MDIAGGLIARLEVAADPVVFQGTLLPHALPALDLWQQEACRIHAPNLLLLCGRQTGKSTFAALLALWKAMMHPGALVLLISPTLRQSTELFRKSMVLYDALKTQPGEASRTKTELHLTNGSSVYSLPGANPDAIRGYSAPDLVIEDEAAFVNDRTFVAYRPMLATNPNGRNVLLTTPYGRRGHFYERWVSDDPRWKRFAIKSDQCERIDSAWLESERSVLSDRAFRQEYQCEFLEAANSVFPADIIERLTENNERRTTMPDETLGLPSVSDIAANMRAAMDRSGVYSDI